MFLNHMNAHAERLALRNTKYTSVHGLNDPQNVSCAQDIV
jgi:D-alanyl-D-alanine carboxypeptidase